MWFTKTNTALCLYKLFNLHFQHKVLMQSMCLNCKEYQYVRWHVLSCRDSRLCPLSSSSSPLLPPSLSASLLSLPFSSVFWKQRSPSITKPIFSARSIVLQTSQVMINKNTQQWKLQQSTSVGVSERSWPVLKQQADSSVWFSPLFSWRLCEMKNEILSMWFTSIVFLALYSRLFLKQIENLHGSHLWQHLWEISEWQHSTTIVKQVNIFAISTV